ncbi:MAG: YtxH domain-containing protein, partial [Chitinophagaceae bacterium]
MSTSKTLLGLAAGAAIGAVAGLLLAPDKGSETRKK